MTDASPLEPTTASGWRISFRIAALCGILPLFVLAFDIIASLIVGAAPSGSRSAAAWFESFAKNPLLGLQGLSFPQVVSTVLFIPFAVGLYGALRARSAGLSLLALALSLAGAALFLSTNAALPMLALSDRFARAGSDAERNALIAAAEAVLVRGTDFTPTGFLSFFLPSVSGAVMSALMIGAAGFGPAVFSRWRGWLGLAGYGFLSLFTIGACWIPGAFGPLLPLSICGGLAVMAWSLTVSLRLWRMSFPASELGEGASLISGQ